MSLPPAYHPHTVDSVGRNYGYTGQVPITPPPAFPPPPEYEGRRRSPNTSRRNGSTEHVITSREHTWVKLRLRKSSANSSSELPSYRTGEEIHGSVELDLKKDKVFQSIDVSVSRTFVVLADIIILTYLS
jgi:hypothetical protein